MEEAKKILYEKAIKKFTLKDIIRSRNYTQKNLIELISRYPGYGRGFKIAHKDWPDHEYYQVRDIKLFSSRYGRVYGVKYTNDEISGNKVEEIKRVLKRGLWKYSLTDPRFTNPIVNCSNGLNYNLVRQQQLMDEKKAFMGERKQKMEKIIQKKEEEPKKGEKTPPKKK